MTEQDSRLNTSPVFQPSDESVGNESSLNVCNVYGASLFSSVLVLCSDAVMDFHNHRTVLNPTSCDTLCDKLHTSKLCSLDYLHLLCILVICGES